MSPAPGSDPPLLETVLGLLGGAALLGLVALLAVAAWQGQGRRDPEPRLELGAPRPAADGWLVPFRATNGGGAPAEQLHLEAQLLLPDGAAQRSDVVIDHLAQGSTIEGAFFFDADPTRGALTARPKGFVRP